MFYLKDPGTLGRPWVLSDGREEDVVCVSELVTRELKRHHILGVDFLYQNYKRKFKGAILNEEDGMNMTIQVCAFLNAVYQGNENLLNIVICPDDSLRQWKYHLGKHGNLRVQTVDTKECPENLDTETGLTLIVCFSNLKVIEQLAEYDYFSVIVDDHDKIATKMVLRKITGLFHIGLTKHNFYLNPDQKLQWTMLNWSNPGCVGKLANFYDIDNDNIANYRDNYRHWWFRLTWHFCESFEPPTAQEIQQYKENVKNWCPSVEEIGPKPEKSRKPVPKVADATIPIKTTKMSIIFKNPITKRYTPVVKESVKKCPTTNNTKTNTPRKNASSPRKGKRKAPDLDASFDNEPTSVVVPRKEFFAHSLAPAKKAKKSPETLNYVKLPSMDEHPIVDSIIRIFEKSPGPCKQPFQFYNEPGCSGKQQTITAKTQDNEDKNMTIDDRVEVTINDEADVTVNEAEISYEQKASDFFRSLIDDGPNLGQQSQSKQQSQQPQRKQQSQLEQQSQLKQQSQVKQQPAPKKFADDEIEKLLRETDKMLESS